VVSSGQKSGSGPFGVILARRDCRLGLETSWRPRREEPQRMRAGGAKRQVTAAGIADQIEQRVIGALPQERRRQAIRPGLDGPAEPPMQLQPQVGQERLPHRLPVGVAGAIGGLFLRVIPIESLSGHASPPQS
jgi:hypothetical protein